MQNIPAFSCRRKITGMSAILLPWVSEGFVDWQGFENHVARTVECGLIPAVNMDTGYAHLIDERTREEALKRARTAAGDAKFVAGAFVGDKPGSDLIVDAYLQQVDRINVHGGTPVIFQSFGLTGCAPETRLEAYRHIGRNTDQFIAFELGKMFAPFGEIYSLDEYRELIQIPQCIGAKHSSLDRTQEWQRLEIRDVVRPEFLVLTGNDLAIDMVFYGSDYLLGLSTFAPDYFALRDRWWLAGDARAIALNDVLQYLGFFAFRNPVPAYKHSAAQFLKRRGWIATDLTHPLSPSRPAADIPILDQILEQLSHFPLHAA